MLIYFFLLKEMDVIIGIRRIKIELAGKKDLGYRSKVFSKNCKLYCVNKMKNKYEVIKNYWNKKK